MCLNKKSGFTLIELMVVIVIIGVLASLAIPRFTEASAKAKLAEGPRVIASWESAQMACLAERGDANECVEGNTVFDHETETKWYTWDWTGAKYEGTVQKVNNTYDGEKLSSEIDNDGKPSRDIDSDLSKALPNFMKP